MPFISVNGLTLNKYRSKLKHRPVCVWVCFDICLLSISDSCFWNFKSVLSFIPDVSRICWLEKSLCIGCIRKMDNLPFCRLRDNTCTRVAQDVAITFIDILISYLTDCAHYVSLSNHCSAITHEYSGVPQCSVLGPILSTMYIEHLSAIIDSHSIIHHSFADDIQMQMSAPPDGISELRHSMQSCISDVKAWATANMH